MKKPLSISLITAALAASILLTGCARIRGVPKGVDVLADYSAAITPLLGSISESTMSRCVQDLCAIPSRVTGRAGCNEARDLLINNFTDYGWKVSTAVFNPVATTAYNVIAEWPGTGADARAVIISAHYDSWGGGNAGAIDDASGCAGLVAIAECVSAASARFTRPIRLIAFSSEEDGQFGAKDYVKTANSSGILAVLNMDAIAPVPYERPSVLCHYKSDKVRKLMWLPEAFSQIAGRYSSVTGISSSYYYSGGKYKFDSDPMEAAGIPAISAVGNGYCPANSPMDTAELVDYEYGKAVTQLVAAAAFTLAGPVVVRDGARYNAAGANAVVSRRD